MNVYDFDKTIYVHDSSADLIKWCLKKRPYLVFPYFFPILRGAIRLFILHQPKEVAKEDFFSLLKYFDNREELIKEFWDTHEQGIKEYYRKQRRDDDLIISASPEFLIKEICDRLHVSCMASPLDLHTLRYTGKNCHGKEKVVRLREITDEQIEEFYSDSLSDTPLAEIAEKAYLVKGDAIEEWPGR